MLCLSGYVTSPDVITIDAVFQSDIVMVYMCLIPRQKPTINTEITYEMFQRGQKLIHLLYAENNDCLISTCRAYNMSILFRYCYASLDKAWFVLGCTLTLHHYQQRAIISSQ
ncbi:hypothetical protein TNIN_281101 [Trichonephila inaurata madagascariensis]|uniref:Uncharacterized protein n=1 Tax=Trichonephila inaurata madagascariensis TaxID=2747483 RepID=A0A8X7C6C2_9ARAC|nr:hypothetical protein TNIN_281101 [Trichonephila inaurata madagascariensis]